MFGRAWAGATARLKPIVGFFLTGFVVLTLSRLGLAWWQRVQISEVEGWSQVLVQGARVDVASLCLLLVPLAIVVLMLPNRVFSAPVTRRGIAAWLAASTTLLVALELATPGFMQEYGLRPNRIFMEYLIYPKEVASTLVKGRPLQTAITLVLSLAVWLATWRLALRSQGMAADGGSAPVPRAALAVALLLLGTLGVRSTLGHRPMNPAMLAFSSNPTVNVLPLNSFYSLAFAMRDWLQESEDGARLYGELPEDEVIATVRAGMGVPATAFIAPDIPTLALRPPTWRGKPRNLVIVLEESLGAQFIGSLGGKPLSPNFDRLSRQGWVFTRLYATGTRSVRGIEAVGSGFMPTPAQAVVKRPRSQQGFFTLAQLLRGHGYDATFYYGGESHFDNMRGFFLGNGFNRIIEQRDYPSPTFVGSWGVSDEDLFLRADKEFRRLHAEGKPFFGLVFTSSNHEPFEFPEDRIALHEEPRQTRNNAAKYADHALGVFFERAMASAYWEDTVFLVVADHDSRVVGRDAVPVDNFHIPGLILGADIAPRQDARLVSQIDLPVTLLSLIGIAEATPMIGRDLSNPDLTLPGRAFMQYDRNFAYMQDDAIVVLRPDRPPSQYRLEPSSRRLVPVPLSSERLRPAHAHALLGSLAYDHGWHRLPERQSR
ncbi:LTA synthase family protein [Xanthomonadaceae bacterium JHOS43]|nr:LTA synthase family protein [Xanthomonadaceae bacterium JHOS43]MCX7563057.1 LTA synthase family protein [Xanthomonadaceae bacterium XH05]